MLQFPDHAREMHKGEEDAVDALLKAAFGTNAEANLVKSLRKSGQIAGETVLPMADRIVGYYALSHMAAPKRWLCLAPVAVAPDVQGRRFGTRMMGQLTEWARLSKSTVVVLGEVPFYERTGFSAKSAARLTTPYPLSHTMLAGCGDAVPVETLIYPKPFTDLG
jgi:putative acetyltransferase